MVTKVLKKAKKVAKKKATITGKNAAISTNVVMTRKQAETVAAFYHKQGKKLPAFLAKKLA